MKINNARLQSYFEAMSEIGKIGETGTCRPAHTALEKQGFEIASSWMKEAGMTTRIDNFDLILRGGLPVAVRYKSFMIYFNNKKTK